MTATTCPSCGIATTCSCHRQPGTRQRLSADGTCSCCYQRQKRRADLDDAVVRRVMHGERLAMNRLERAEVVRRLTRQGLSAAQIRDRTGLCERTVQRHRVRMRVRGVAA